jgi:hypothetical protein
MFVAAGGKLQTVALAGAAAPDIAGASFTSFDWPALDDAGNLAFLATVRRGRGSSDAIFLYRGELRRLVAAGDEAPGGGVFAGLGAPAMNNHGVVAFAAVVEQGPVLGGLFTIEEGQPRLALAAGSPAPGGGILAKFSEQVAIDDAGSIAFSAVLRQDGRAAGVFVLDHGGALRAVAATGDPAPGGGIFAAFPSWPVLSRSGAVGFIAAVDGGSSPLSLYLARGGAVERLTGIGDLLADGSSLGSFARYPAIAIGPDDGVTFAGAAKRDGALKDALFYLRPPRRPG